MLELSEGVIALAKLLGSFNTFELWGCAFKLIFVALCFFHQRGIITKMPNIKPNAKAAKTTSTNGDFHKVPKKKWTTTNCWLFSAKEKSVKKMVALNNHIRYFIKSIS